jgi:hypothetical protein
MRFIVLFQPPNVRLCTPEYTGWRGARFQCEYTHLARFFLQAIGLGVFHVSVLIETEVAGAGLRVPDAGVERAA